MKLLIIIGLFLGFSNSHSCIVADSCHLLTGYVSTQYHLVFDDLFEAVFDTGNDALLNDVCNHIVDTDCGFYFYDDDVISDDPLIYYLSPHDEFWHSEPEQSACHCNLEECHLLTGDSA